MISGFYFLSSRIGSQSAFLWSRRYFHGNSVRTTAARFTAIPGIIAHLPPYHWCNHFFSVIAFRNWVAVRHRYLFALRYRTSRTFQLPRPICQYQGEVGELDFKWARASYRSRWMRPIADRNALKRRRLSPQEERQLRIACTSTFSHRAWVLHIFHYRAINYYTYESWCR